MNARLVTFDIGCQQLKVYRRKALDRMQRKAVALF